jgi:putative ABC transport system ATP-binding protein
MLVQLRGVHFAYVAGDFTLAVQGLDVNAGERVALVGPSGCGKSTLLSIVAGLAAPQAGRVVVDGLDLASCGDSKIRTLRAQRLGLVHQDFQLFDALNVVDNILLPYHVNRALALDVNVRDRASELAQRAGLGSKLRRTVTRLSQGERQRVAVCRALVARPALVLADEPTASLDHRTRDQIVDLLLNECQRAGAAILAATHDPQLVQRMERTVVVELDPQGGAHA